MSEAKINKTLLWVFVVLLTIAGIMSYFYVASENVQQTKRPKEVTVDPSELPDFKQIPVIENITKPWDVAVSNSGQIFFTEKAGGISRVENGARVVLETPDDLRVEGEAGLMGLTLDTNFDENRLLYVCFASNESGNPDVRVVRYSVDQDFSGLSDRTDIITGIPYNTTTYPGRHSGCRPRMLGDYLYVSTGDAAIGTTPQDPQSLGGKILRVDREGNGHPDNIGGEFDERIFSYGHRNPQGVAFFEGEYDDGCNDLPPKEAALCDPNPAPIGYSAEHGSRIDDEVNELVPGGNFGWDPVPGYSETGTPMTDLEKFPEAVEAVWSSGSSTVAVSGLDIINGQEWGKLNGVALVAVQKRQHVRALVIDHVTRELVEEFEFINNLGRVRSVVQAPNGDIYIATDNGGGDDKIVRLTVR